MMEKWMVERFVNRGFREKERETERERERVKWRRKL